MKPDGKKLDHAQRAREIEAVMGRFAAGEPLSETDRSWIAWALGGAQQEEIERLKQTHPFPSLRPATTELIAYLLDEAVPLGEMHRLVGSVRQTLSERARGIEEYTSPAAAATTSAASALVDLLLTPFEPARKDDSAA